MNRIVLEGKTIRDNIIKDLKEYIHNNKMYISFVIISIGDDEASKVYIGEKQKLASELNIECKVIKKAKDIKTEEVIELIEDLNKDEAINGILVQLPIPEHLDKDKILNSIDPKKDIDGLTSYNLGKLINNEKGLFPATASGVIKLFKYYNIDLAGKNVLVINKSTLVGKPLALMLIEKGATVTIAHSKTIDLNQKLKNFDIIISAVGKKDLIKFEDVNEDTILVDIGVSRIDGKIYGDIEERLKERNTSTPTIGGVGPLTIALLAENIVYAYKLQNSSLLDN